MAEDVAAQGSAVTGHKNFVGDGWLYASVRALVLASAIASMMPGAWGHSATVVEFAHLPAGLFTLEHHTLGIYRVCGPVSKVLYALPAYVAGVRVGVGDVYDTSTGGRHEWDLGRRFQVQTGESYHLIYRWSRLLPILLTVVGGILICEWSTRLFGRWPGIVSLCVWCWLPPVLAHGALVTSDMAAAVALLCAGRSFWAFLLRPSLGTSLLAGLTLGLAASTKFTLLGLYPCWLLLLFCRVVQVLRIRETGPGTCRSPALWLVSMGLLLFATSLVVIAAAYGFGDVGFTLADWRSGQSSLARDLRSLADSRATAWLLRCPLPIPLELVRGLDCQLADTERLQSVYLFGQTHLGGLWYWYAIATLVKVPLPALVLFGLSLVRIRRAASDHAVVWAMLCLFLPAAEGAFVVAASTGTGTNAAYRYLIPTLALTCVWSGRAAGVLPGRPLGEGSGRRGSIRRASIAALLLWLLLNAVIALPDHLGSQNEAGWAWRRWSGQPALIGDSLDWGQDLERLGTWVARHANDGTTLVCAYGLGTGDPYGLRPPAARPTSDPGDHPAHLAVSEDILHGYEVQSCVRIGGGSSFLDLVQREGLLRVRPIARVGRTICIYRVRDIPADLSIPDGGRYQ